MALFNLSKAKFDPKILPDEDDTNYYCRSCDKTFANKYSYKAHLKNVHKMHVITPKPRPKVDLSISPDINDPNFNCRVCKYTYKSKGNYREHIKRVHKIDLPLLQKRSIHDPNMKVNTNDPKNTSCGYCKVTLSTKV